MSDEAKLIFYFEVLKTIKRWTGYAELNDAEQIKGIRTLIETLELEKETI